MKNYKILIVGSGPGGISTAMHLIRLNPELKDEILVLEKQEHPREKVCAGGVTGNAQKAIYELGINFRRLDISKVDADVWRFRMGDEWADTFETGFVTVARRDELDAALVATARQRGIKVNEKEEVTDLERIPEGIKVITNKDEYMAQILVGADGVGSVVRQKLVGKNEEYNFSRLHLIETPVKEEETPEFLVGAVSFDMTYVPEGMQGYVWDFPCYIDGKPHLTRGIVDHNPNPSTRVDIMEIFRRAMEKRGVNIDNYKLKTLPEIQFDPASKLSSDRVLLVGDSAGIDPLMGEGLSQAMNYGKFAAGYMLDKLGSGDLSFVDYNQKLLETPFIKEVLFCQMFANNIYRENPLFWLSLFWKDRMMHKVIVGGFAGHIYMHQVPQELIMQKAGAHKAQGDFSLPSGVRVDL